MTHTSAARIEPPSALIACEPSRILACLKLEVNHRCIILRLKKPLNELCNSRGPELAMRLSPYHGLLVFDKPAGVTSRDVVNRVQRCFPRGTRIGHAGTLDPLATGEL